MSKKLTQHVKPGRGKLGLAVPNGNQPDVQSTERSRQRRAPAQDQEPDLPVHPDDELIQLQHKRDVEIRLSPVRQLRGAPQAAFQRRLHRDRLDRRLHADADPERRRVRESRECLVVHAGPAGAGNDLPHRLPLLPDVPALLHRHPQFPQSILLLQLPGRRAWTAVRQNRRPAPHLP